MRTLSFLFLGLILLACGPTAETPSDHTSNKSDTTTMEATNPIYELAVRATKEGQLATFEGTRSKFIAKLQGIEGAEVDREFQAFYALPEPNPTPVFIGMTKWASMEAAGAAAQQLMATEEAQAFFGTFDFLAYALMTQTEGPELNLATLAAEARQVLEISVRRTKEGQDAIFNERRKAFVDHLSAKEGVLESYEFAVVGSMPGMDTEGLSVGMTVYESQEAFQAVAGPLMQEAVTQTYFTTFDIVASQFAVSIK